MVANCEKKKGVNENIILHKTCNNLLRKLKEINILIKVINFFKTCKRIYE